jgi:hypothetical protein
VGAPLKGVSVKVIDLFFMVGLSQQDRQVNMALLHERPWFDVPVVFSDHRRAFSPSPKYGRASACSRAPLRPGKPLADRRPRRVQASKA